MRTTSFKVAAVVSATLVWASAAPAASTGLGGLTGRVSDASGAALPGVTVTASCTPQGRLASTVTNGHGEYLLEGLPPGTCSVAFELPGFEPKALPSVQLLPDRTGVLDNELTVAPIEETVEVFAQRPPEPDPVPLAPPPVVEPSLRPIAAYDLSAVCGPSLLTESARNTPAIASLIGARRDFYRRLYTKGEGLVVDGGAAAGLKEGDNFVVRRRFKAVLPRVDEKQTLEGEHSAGLVQIVSVRGDSADAVVVYACDAFTPGDYLAPFVPTVLSATNPRGKPDYDRVGTILFADEGQQLGSPRRLMVTNMGQNQGAQPGQRLTVFRPKRALRPDVEIGEAVVVSVAPDSSTIRIEHANDGVWFGDRVALQR